MDTSMRSAMDLKLLGIVLATAVALAQPQTEPAVRPAFDVASVKPAPPDEALGYRFEPGGRMVVSHFRLADLMLIGWHILPFQVVGGPAWAYSETYDIEAKAAGNPDSDQSRIMLQSLLADRFHLALYRDTRELPMYALVTAKKGARPAAGLVRAKEGDCTPASQDFPQPPLDAGKPAYCRVTQQFRRQDNGAPSVQLRGYGVTLSMLARSLASTVYQQVEDNTGIAGNYDVNMDYAPYNENDNDSLTPKPDTGVQSLFTALQEQLGLKLEARKGPVEVLVIDRAERPSGN
jgi:uncharacterized protein (TIGR03435 family)